MTRKIYFFTVMTALFLLAAPGLRAAQSGTCGTSVTWTLDDQGVLTIEGTGAMYDYLDDSPQWTKLTLTEVVIKDGVTGIGGYAFEKCTGLTSVTIPNSVTSIGKGAFYRCTGLTSVTIPSSVTSIGKDAFCYCEGLTSVTIPSSVTSIGESVFANCTGLKSLTIPASVTSIGEYAFSGSTGLTSMTLPGSVTSIGAAAFYGCTGMTSVTIPASVTSIGEMAFVYCSGLDTITVDAENSTFDSRDNCNAIIETKTNTLIVGCKSTTIPSSVTSIGEMAYAFCTGLTSVTIPASVTSVGNYAFAYCSGLEKIESLAENPPTCGSYVFYDVDKSKCVLTVPVTSVEAYKAANGWKDLINIVSGISGVAQDNNAGVSVRNGEITVTGVADNAVVEVYSTSGALVYRGASKTVSVPSAGIYIVKAAGRTFKVKTAR